MSVILQDNWNSFTDLKSFLQVEASLIHFIKGKGYDLLNSLYICLFHLLYHFYSSLFIEKSLVVLKYRIFYLLVVQCKNKLRKILALRLCSLPLKRTAALVSYYLDIGLCFLKNLLFLLSHSFHYYAFLIFCSTSSVCCYVSSTLFILLFPAWLNFTEAVFKANAGPYSSLSLFFLISEKDS